VLKKFECLDIKCHRSKVQITKSGDDNYKTWTDYYSAIKEFLDGVNSDKRFEGARKETAEYIWKYHYKVFPLWPKAGEEQSQSIPLGIKGLYICTQNDDDYEIAWTVEGMVMVKDVRKTADSYLAEFSGEPEFKVISLNHRNLGEFESRVKLLPWRDVQSKLRQHEKDYNKNIFIGF